MLLSFLCSAQVSDVFVLRLPLLSFFRFQGLTYTFEVAVRLLFVASLEVTLLVVVVVVVVVVSVTLVLVAVIFVAVVIVIRLAGDEVLFLHAAAPTPTGAFAVVALRFSSSISSIYRLLNDP